MEQQQEEEVLLEMKRYFDKQRELEEFYSTYDVWTGIRTAITLALFFIFTVTLILYKSKCKPRRKYELYPSLEDMPGRPLDYCDYWCSSNEGKCTHTHQASSVCVGVGGGEGVGVGVGVCYRVDTVGSAPLPTQHSLDSHSSLNNSFRVKSLPGSVMRINSSRNSSFERDETVRSEYLSVPGVRLQSTGSSSDGYSSVHEYQPTHDQHHNHTPMALLGVPGGGGGGGMMGGGRKGGGGSSVRSVLSDSSSSNCNEHNLNHHHHHHQHSHHQHQQHNGYFSSLAIPGGGGQRRRHGNRRVSSVASSSLDSPEFDDDRSIGSDSVFMEDLSSLVESSCCFSSRSESMDSPSPTMFPVAGSPTPTPTPMPSSPHPGSSPTPHPASPSSPSPQPPSPCPGFPSSPRPSLSSPSTRQSQKRKVQSYRLGINPTTGIGGGGVGGAGGVGVGVTPIHAPSSPVPPRAQQTLNSLLQANSLLQTKDNIPSLRRCNSAQGPTKQTSISGDDRNSRDRDSSGTQAGFKRSDSEQVQVRRSDSTSGPQRQSSESSSGSDDATLRGLRPNGRSNGRSASRTLRRQYSQCLPVSPTLLEVPMSYASLPTYVEEGDDGNTDFDFFDDLLLFPVAPPPSPFRAGHALYMHSTPSPSPYNHRVPYPYNREETTPSPSPLGRRIYREDTIPSPSPHRVPYDDATPSPSPHHRVPYPFNREDTTPSPSPLGHRVYHDDTMPSPSPHHRVHYPFNREDSTPSPYGLPPYIRLEDFDSHNSSRTSLNVLHPSGGPDSSSFHSSRTSLNVLHPSGGGGGPDSSAHSSRTSLNLLHPNGGGGGGPDSNSTSFHSSRTSLQPSVGPDSSTHSSRTSLNVLHPSGGGEGPDSSSASSFHSSRTSLVSPEERGLWADYFPNTNINHLSQTLTRHTNTIYAGFDPTADSLHVGNLLVLVALLHCQRAGHHTIALVGGGTGRVGDPSGRTTSRTPLTQTQLTHNTQHITHNIQHIFHNHNEYFNTQGASLHPLRVVNNLDWYQGVCILDFLEGVGNSLRVGDLLSRHSVHTRLSSQHGLSYTEFSYQALQAYDWLYLYDKYNCTIQIGGSDQMGNIYTGHYLIEKERDTQVTGLTLPLIKNKSGEKFGKSSGNCVWLSEKHTSPFELYQYFINTKDSEVEKLLLLFTFLPIEDIKNIMNKQRSEPEKRHAQTKLAENVTLLVHGISGLEAAQHTTMALYSPQHSHLLTHLTTQEMERLFTSITSLVLEPGISILELALKAGTFKDTYTARRIIEGGGFYINQSRVNNADLILIPHTHILLNGLTLLRVGKKKYYLVKWLNYSQ
ncbi:hypothetical protein Pmani_024354 [Petrolisthes manimaculis]|uniref:Tyrosine--tRNA ligase n=1 Tax=Petrolisthes manimaculis TaxID=1843537 RepID=A0AAE1P7P4_9EUCA|nr:hypothetical protein Pmani_024354 [Petrolisthes manimaculis]